jgi:transcriptional regulator with XRE-family HTH domain
MANKSFWGKLASKNKKSAYEVSKETGIPEEKVKEVLSGDRKLPTKHVDAVVKSIQTKTTNSDVDYLNAKRFFETENLHDLRVKFNYLYQRDLANAVNVPLCYVSNLENKKFKEVSKSALIKLYDFFQDELNVNVKSSGTKATTKKSSVSISKNATDVTVIKVKPTNLLKKDFNAKNLFEELKGCQASSVIELYKLLDNFIQGK